MCGVHRLDADLRRGPGGEPAGAVLVADRGDAAVRPVWASPPGSATSVLLRPRRPLLDWGWLSLLVGLAVADGIRRLGGGDRVTLKWPNDVLIDQRKVCGILSERVVTGQGDAAVCGWGIHVSMVPAELPIPGATSLLLAGLPTDKSQLLAGILARLAWLTDRWDAGDDLRADYAAGCATIGRRVRVHLDSQAPDGRSVAGTRWRSDNGELLVDIGGASRAAAGDVLPQVGDGCG